MTKFRIARGSKANLPDLAEGEPGLCTDTKEIYIGTNGGNIKVSATREDLPYYSQSGAPLQYGSETAAGIDLPYYDEKRHGNLSQYSKFGQWWRKRKLILPFVRYKLPTGMHVEMAPDEYGEIDSRSSTSKKKMLPLCRTIDSDYRGNIHVVFMMISLRPRIIKMGECRFQMVVKPFNRKSPRRVFRHELSTTVRADNGFGHTDQKNKEE